jgi:hypothetical protein
MKLPHERRNVVGEMRNPIKSETDAFRITVAFALLAGYCVLIGWLTAPLVGGMVFAVIGGLAVTAYLCAPDPDRRMALGDAAHESHPHGAHHGQRHVLVVANEALAGEELRERIVGLDGDRVEVDVLAPVLSSRVRYAVSDIDHGLEEARARLDRSLAWAREQGIVARGEVGDPSPITAIEDELRDFGPDEVILATHARERETWQERGELKRLRRELDLPITHVVVGDAAAPR